MHLDMYQRNNGKGQLKRLSLNHPFAFWFGQGWPIQNDMCMSVLLLPDIQSGTLNFRLSGSEVRV